jgi:hypothetical protein
VVKRGKRGQRAATNTKNDGLKVNSFAGNLDIGYEGMKGKSAGSPTKG